MPKFSINDSVYKRDDPKTPLLILAIKSSSENVPSPSGTSAKKEAESKSAKTKHKKDEKVKEEEKDEDEEKTEEKEENDSVEEEKEEGKRKAKRDDDEGDEEDEPAFQYRVLDTLNLCDGGWVPEDALVALPARARRSSSSSSSSASSAQPANKKRRLTGTSSSSSSLTSSASGSSSQQQSSSLHQSGDSVSLNESGEAICPELGIKLPQRLQERLVDDAHLITDEKLVPPLPRHPSISDLLNDYKERLVAKSGGNKESVLPDEVVESIVVYFNRFIDPCLLYPAEKAFFKPVTKDKDPVEVYGVEHLLRFFARWQALCFDAKVSEDSLASIALRLIDIFDFIIENEDKYFAKNYVPPKSLKLSSQKRK